MKGIREIGWDWEPYMWSRLALLLLSLLVAPSSFAGAWGYGSFDNDDAMDWLSELEEHADTQFVVTTLQAVDPKAKYIEAPECSQALAAAEVVAAARARPAKNLPAPVTKWLKHVRLTASAHLLESARSAVRICRESDVSELRELWQDSPQAAAWLADTAALLARLK